jgi:uncharacterized protein (TIGR02611 family)
MPVAVRKPFVFIIGSSVIATGLVMLIFPGPGWAAIFVGFAILATEFAFAERVRDWMVRELKTIIKNSKLAWKTLWRKLRNKN